MEISLFTLKMSPFQDFQHTQIPSSEDLSFYDLVWKCVEIHFYLSIELCAHMWNFFTLSLSMSHVAAEQLW